MGPPESKDTFDPPEWWCARPHRPSWEELAAKYGPRLGVEPAAALGALKLLYTSEICCKLRTTRHGRQLLTPLFVAGFRDWVVSSLLLGHDLAAFPKWKDDSEFADRLRRLKTFRGARFELGALAGLQRLGLAGVRGAGPKDRLKPDILISDDKATIAIELKALDPALLDTRMSLIQDALGRALLETRLIFEQAASYVLEPARELISWLTDSRANRDEDAVPLEVFDRLRDGLHAKRSSVRPNKTIDITAAGLLRIGSPEFDTTGTIDVKTARQPTDYVFRLLRALHDASRQLATQPATFHAAAVWLPSRHMTAHAAAQALIERLRADRKRIPPNVDVAFLQWGDRVRGPWREECVPVVLTPKGREAMSMQWPKGIANWRYTSDLPVEEDAA